VGVRAVGEIFLIRRGGEAKRAGTAGTAGVVGVLESLENMVLGRLERGEFGSEGGWWVELDDGGGGGVLSMCGLIVEGYFTCRGTRHASER